MGHIGFREVTVGGYRMFKAQTYREHAKARYGVQLPLFDEEDGKMGTP